MSASQLNRIAAMVALVEGSHSTIGRTALMKLCFFLQVIRKVPLGYSFSLYSYGPFDSDVMSDLQTAEGLNALKSQTVIYPGGYGYDISPGPQAAQLKDYSKEFVDQYADEVGWVSTTFGRYSATDLELMSTIVFVSIKESSLANPAIAQRVNVIKPHFSMSQIQSKVDWLDSQSLLRRGEI
jgi:uncharacterized protein